MRALIFAIAAAAIAAFPLQASHAQLAGVAPPSTPQQVTPAPGSIFPGNVIQSCGPVSATLGALGASLALPCAGAGSFIILIQPTGGAPLVGTFASTDSVTGGNRLLFKTGVGPMGVSAQPVNGTAGQLEYRTVGGNGQTITLTSYTSGSALVTIYGSYNPQDIFIGGPVHTAEEDALRNGKAFSSSSGVQMVTAGQYMSMMLANPSNSGVRAIITKRTIACDNPTGQVAPKWYGLANPTLNLPATVTAISPRKTGGSTSLLNSTYTASSATFPDTTTSTPLASRVSALIPTGGGPGGPGDVMRTLEPGQSTVLTILATANGLGTNPSCAIDTFWYEESVN